MQASTDPKKLNVAETAPSDAALAALLASDGPVVQLLRTAFPQALAIYAFGSRVNGTAQADSDLDLAVLVPGYADPVQLWDVASQLADLVGCSVDLLDFRAASTVMQYQVLQESRLLWATQPAAGLFECFVLSEKLDFDAARSGLLADIAKRGSIYG
jgi:predicted nucleotidyltransferase